MDQLKDTLKIGQMIARHLSGDADPELQRALEDWAGQNDANQKLFKELSDEQKRSVALSELEQADTEPALAKVKERIRAGEYQKPAHRLWYYTLGAAAVLCIAFLAWLFYPVNKRQETLSVFSKNDIGPGGNKAYLTLANGQRISLNDAVNGALTREQGVEITKTADGQLIYTAKGNPRASGWMNTIETPRGGQYQVLLPDGSHVWLNAASKLVYPVSFDKKGSRKVQLSGEGYFEIAKDPAHPFIVKTAMQEVRVLGTHFNISSYQEEPGIRTTLLEGSVQIETEKGRNVLLKPGEQSLNHQQQIEVRPADLEAVMAWKNGDFVFKKESLAGLMRQISRWYDVEVTYMDERSKDVILSGYISRSRKISAVLERIQGTGKVRFKLEGRHILVLPKT